MLRVVGLSKGSGAAVAVGMWDKMLAFLGFEEEEGAQDEGLLAAAAAPALPAVGGARPEVARRRPVRGGRGNWAEERPEVRAPLRGASVTRLVAAAPGFVVAAPKRFEESQEVADHLKAGQPVLVYLEGIERELAQRLVNFLAGSVYALGGEMHRIGSVVLFVPAGVDVTLPLSLRMAERDGR